MPEQYIGSYRLLSVLGYGPGTTVYKALQPALNRPVALKVLRKPESDALRRLQMEAQLTASLSDLHVRQVYEAGRAPEGQVYVALQYVDYSLKDVLNQRKTQRRPFTRAEVVELLEPIADVLDKMHNRSLIHLDIKPENILIFKGSGRAVLADFGIVQKAGTTTRTGTPLYASPEQAAGDRPVGPWSDVYSLGVVAYEMIAGRPPFKGDTDLTLLRQHLDETPPRLRTLRRGVEFDLDETIARALSKEPDKRFATVGEFVAALRQRQAPASLMLKRTGAAFREMPSVLRRQPRLGVFLLVIVIIATAVLGIARSPRLSSLPKATLTPTSPAPETLVTIAPATITPSPVVAPTVTTRPTSTSSPTRLRTLVPTRPPTLASAPPVYPAPILVQPPSEAVVNRSKVVEFNWTWEKSLKPDERYRFQFWKDGQLVGEAYLTRDTWRHSAAPTGPGRYEWGVDIVRLDQSGRIVQALSSVGGRWWVTWQ